jgi:tetratricopeptide (TPR) repeat protein
MPLQARSLESLSRREYARYRQARGILASGGGVLALSLGDIPLAGLGVYEALLAQSWVIRYVSPEDMVRLAQAALEVAQEFAPKRYGAKRITDLQARAWGELANAYRAADRLRLSQETFGQAYAVLEKGSGDPYLQARLFDLEASLLGTWREFPLALHRLKSLSDLYRNLGEVHLAGRTLITRALYTAYSGEAEEALELNAEGLALIDRQQDPVLYMMAVHNHLMFLVELGCYGTAKRTLFENRRYVIYRGVGAQRFRALEGRISYGLGQWESAEIAFREAKVNLADAGKSFFCALVCLELAMALVRQNRHEEAEREVLAAREIFLSQEVYREYVGSVIFLEVEFRRKAVTAELIEATVAHLRRKELQIQPRDLR